MPTVSDHTGLRLKKLWLCGTRTSRARALCLQCVLLTINGTVQALTKPGPAKSERTDKCCLAQPICDSQGLKGRSGSGNTSWGTLAIRLIRNNSRNTDRIRLQFVPAKDGRCRLTVINPEKFSTFRSRHEILTPDSHVAKTSSIPRVRKLQAIQDRNLTRLPAFVHV